jgi:hypothetical protein
MSDAKIREMRADDWAPARIQAGSYSNPRPLTGYQLGDAGGTGGRQGNTLHPVHGDRGFEERLARTHAVLRTCYPGLYVRRVHARMPYLDGSGLPGKGDYRFVDAPQRLTTTSITVLLVPQAQVCDAALGYYYDGEHLPSLRERLHGQSFQGIAGNLGYYMTAALIGNDPGTAKTWAHSRRYPGYPLPTLLSYIGFSLCLDPKTGEMQGTFHGAHPGTVGIRSDGGIELLPRLAIDGYLVTMGGQTFSVEAVDRCDDGGVGPGVMLWTPALQTPEIRAQIAAAETSAGVAEDWQHNASMVPLADDRVHVFVANEGDGRRPVSKVAAVWERAAPVPSFGGVLSFARERFRRLYGPVESFRQRALGNRVQVVPLGATHFEQYTQMLGGLVPAVVDGEHVLRAESMQGVMAALNRWGNANSPLAQAGRESRNFDPIIREPAGVLVQAAGEAGGQMGWVLFDGRHEASIGANVVDVAVLLDKLQYEGLLPPVQQALFVDGGSAMKVYHVQSDGADVQLDLLNRVAAGSRNPPGRDPDGLNLYTLLALELSPN